MSIPEFLPAGMALVGFGLRYYLSAPPHAPEAHAPATVALKRPFSRLLASMRRALVSIAHGGEIRA